MSTVKYISFEEFAENFATILNQVRDGLMTVVVEYASGEKVVIRALPLTSATTGEDQNDRRQAPPNRISNTENKSSVGAVYEIDPDSITPG